MGMTLNEIGQLNPAKAGKFQKMSGYDLDYRVVDKGHYKGKSTAEGETVYMFDVPADLGTTTKDISLILTYDFDMQRGKNTCFVAFTDDSGNEELVGGTYKSAYFIINTVAACILQDLKDHYAKGVEIDQLTFYAKQEGKGKDRSMNQRDKFYKLFLTKAFDVPYVKVDSDGLSKLDIPEGWYKQRFGSMTEAIMEAISFSPDFTEDEVDFIDDFADDVMDDNPEIDLSGQHFFDRLNDPRNFPDIEPTELEDFFERLAKKADQFREFLLKYKEVVVTDVKTNINIPFMKMANKAIAKTIMRHKNFRVGPTAQMTIAEVGEGTAEPFDHKRSKQQNDREQFTWVIWGEVDGEDLEMFLTGDYETVAGQGYWTINFGVKGKSMSTVVNGGNDFLYRMMATVKAILLEEIQRRNIKMIFFEPSEKDPGSGTGSDPRRAKLYMKYLEKSLPNASLNTELSDPAEGAYFINIGKEKTPFKLKDLFKEIDAGTQTQGTNEKELIQFERHLRQKYSDVLDRVYMFVEDDGNRIELNMIKILPEAQGQGHASKIMGEIVRWAKSKNVSVSLTPSDTFGSDPERLRQFYSRFGFEKNTDRSIDDEMIMREEDE